MWNDCLIEGLTALLEFTPLWAILLSDQMEMWQWLLRRETSNQICVILFVSGLGRKYLRKINNGDYESNNTIPIDMLPVLKEAIASGKSLRELAKEIGLSHETIRAALKS